MPWVIMMFFVNETPLLDWWAGFITFALLLVIILVFRDQLFEGAAFKWPVTPFWKKFVWISEGSLSAIQQDWLITSFNQFAISFGRLTHSISQVLEGEGGVLWVFLLLALFASLLAGGGGV